jgi:tetratricopeptide (TPR) repeat protein
MFGGIMYRQALWIVAVALGLAGCAAPGIVPGPTPDAIPWLDKTFSDEPATVTVGKEELFQLDPALQARLRDANLDGLGTQQKLKHILALIFGADLRGFHYAAGRSTIAAETWQRKSGDCLSLTVLTYSVARALQMPTQMQEVRVPLLFDRRGQLDVVNQHVNVLFRPGSHRTPEEAAPRDIVIDFEPEFASNRPGKPLSEDAILARYYNNVATEHLVAGRRAMAYAHFKAAILADPSFAASYGNLAVLYRGAGRLREAEQLLVQAVKLSDPPDVPLHTLTELLTAQGRTAEAQRYAEMLRAGRERDPYYWIGQGLAHLDGGDARQAIAALEHARDISHGFDEVHRYLALAYWRAGQASKARRELMALAAIGDQVGLEKLKRSIKGPKPGAGAPPS